MASDNLRVALAQYDLEPHSSFEAWRDNASDWVARAAKDGAKLLVFPEYCSTDLAIVAGYQPGETANDLMKQMSGLKDRYVDAFVELARKHGVYIVAGTLPVNEDNKYFNRSFFMSPTGAVGHQDKMMLTRFEREKTSLSAGEGFSLFQTDFGRMAIAVCFDVQFPLTIHKLAEANADLLIVPSCTGKLAGNHRVRVGCQARALENQMAVVQSPTVGDAPWQSIADTNRGVAGAFAPPDYGFPENGILALGEVDQPGWVFATIDFSAFERVRKDGHVLNRQCWGEQADKMAFAVKPFPLA